MQAYLNIQTLTSRRPSESDIRNAIDSFVSEFGWKPSFSVNERGNSNVTNANVLLEQGLEISAMVSFLKDREFGSLSYTELKSMLEISYNNLVDWHIFVDQNFINVIFNRSSQGKAISARISVDDVDPLYYRNIDKLISRSARGDINSLDDEIINNIAKYRRLIHNELGDVSIEDISSLMNSVILLRSMEDISDTSFTRLHEAWYAASKNGTLLSEFIAAQAILRNQGSELPDYLLDENSLRIFNSCSIDTIFQLFRSFYGNTQYKYDFSLMTRHALGKIYEKYVTELEVIKTTQIPLFEGLLLSSEKRSYAGGTVYTPQYIASYFSKLALEYLGATRLASAKVADPACGSGVFLRNYLEKALEATLSVRSSKNGIAIFNNVYGIDINKNAANASKLSLSLLALSVFNSLPDRLEVYNTDSISKLPEKQNEYDIVFCNPPYESSDKLSEDEKVNHLKVLGNYKTGTKFDAYLSFLILSIKSLKKGGYGFFVLPQTFLSNAFSSGIRAFISEQCYIHRIVDLSSISDVFSNVSTYVILLVVQKKDDVLQNNVMTQIVKAKSFPGYALEFSLEKRMVSNDFVEIFYRTYENFSRDWRLVGSDQDRILNASSGLIQASEIFDIQQGVLSGADDIFILSDNRTLEPEILVNYLPDRGMSRYRLDIKNVRRMLYPYSESTTLLPISYIAKNYPHTLSYLEANRDKLEKRAEKDESNWWGFTRPRKRAFFERPKIISPNLVISPKFSLDLSDNLYVSRSTYLGIKASIYNNVGEEIALNMLKFYLGILNSTIFYTRIQTNARKYRGSYIKVEVKTLRESTIPDFFNIDQEDIDEMVRAVDTMVLGGETEEGREIVEAIAARAYGIN